MGNAGRSGGGLAVIRGGAATVRHSGFGTSCNTTISNHALSSFNLAALHMLIVPTLRHVLTDYARVHQPCHYVQYDDFEFKCMVQGAAPTPACLPHYLGYPMLAVILPAVACQHRWQRPAGTEAMAAQLRRVASQHL